MTKQKFNYVFWLVASTAFLVFSAVCALERNWQVATYWLVFSIFSHLKSQEKEVK